MGKYKLWLHHQEIGRRLRDQINTLEQERGRVQKMAPSHVTNLPELENPIIAALVSFTRAGNKLSNIDVIKAAMPKMDPALEPRRPAASVATPGARTGAAAPSNEAVVASLLARADSMPADPLEQMRQLSQGAAAGPRPDARPAARPDAAARPPQQGGAPQQGGSAADQAKRVDSIGGWLQRHRSDE